MNDFLASVLADPIARTYAGFMLVVLIAIAVAAIVEFTGKQP